MIRPVNPRWAPCSAPLGLHDDSIDSVHVARPGLLITYVASVAETRVPLRLGRQDFSWPAAMRRQGDRKVGHLTGHNLSRCLVACLHECSRAIHAEQWPDVDITP